MADSNDPEYWKKAYYDLRQQRVTEAERQVETIKMLSLAKESAYLATVESLEKALTACKQALPMGLTLPDEMTKRTYPLDTSAASSSAPSSLSTEERDALLSQIAHQKCVLVAYEALTSVQLRLSPSTSQASSSSSSSSSINDFIVTAMNREKRLATRFQLSLDSSSDDVTLQGMANPQYLPEYLQDGAEVVIAKRSLPAMLVGLMSSLHAPDDDGQEIEEEGEDDGAGCRGPGGDDDHGKTSSHVEENGKSRRHRTDTTP